MSVACRGRGGRQRGSALIPAVALLTSLTLLAMMALMAGGADLALATRRTRERTAFYAAESALETALAELAGGASPLPPEALVSPWETPMPEDRRWRDGDWECARRIRLLPDTRDADGDPATPVVLYDRSFGYEDSSLERGGFAVVQVLASAASGESGQGAAAEVAPVTCAPRVDAAWVAAGPLELAGDLRVAGPTPALLTRAPVLLTDGAAVEGDAAVDPSLSLPVDVAQLLRCGGTLPSLAGLPPPPVDGTPLAGIAWSRGDFAASLAGGGILVVHNPDFDPVRHEASRRWVEEGVVDDGYDPAYSHFDPARQPARFEPLGGSFSGLVVADTVAGCSSEFSLAGALVTLSRSPQTVTAHAPLRISRSAAALARAGRGPLRHVVSFRALPRQALGLP